MNDWSPRKQWWMDVLKFCITFILGALLTVTIINKFESCRAKQEFIWKRQYESNLRIYQDFTKYSLLYHRMAVDAYSDVTKRKKREESENIERFLTEANHNLQLVLESVEQNFGKPVELKKLRIDYDDIFTEYKRTYSLIHFNKEQFPDAELNNRIQEFRWVADQFLISRTDAMHCIERKLREESE